MAFEIINLLNYLLTYHLNLNFHTGTTTRCMVPSADMICSDTCDFKTQRVNCLSE